MAFSISKAWDESSTILKRDGKAIWTVALALIAMPFTLLTLLAPSSAAAMDGAAASTQPSFLSLIITIVLLTATLAITVIALRPQSTVGEAIKEGARKTLAMIGAYLLVWIPLFIVLTILAMVMIGANADPEALQSSLAAGSWPASLTKFLLVCIVIALMIGIKLMMMTPVAAAETGNPLKIVSRSWRLTQGHFLKLLGFTLLFVLAAVIALSAVIFIFGGIVIAVFGQPEAMTVGALFTGLVMGLCYAGFMAVYAVMIARIYVQLASPEATVPQVERA
jgi:hypothetical protein